MNSPYKCYILPSGKAVCEGFTAIMVMNYLSTMSLKNKFNLLFKKLSSTQ